MVTCEVCQKEATEVFECGKCDSKFCEKCSASYNQFSQIDYDCCRPCASYMKGCNYND